MTTNQEFKNAALSALKGNWAQAVLATIVYCVIVCIVSGGDVNLPAVHSRCICPWRSSVPGGFRN